MRNDDSQSNVGAVCGSSDGVRNDGGMVDLADAQERSGADGGTAMSKYDDNLRCLLIAIVLTGLILLALGEVLL